MKYAIVVAHPFGAAVFFFATAADRANYVTSKQLPGLYAYVDPEDWEEQ